MRTSILSIFKPLALAIAVIAIMTIGQGVAQADEVLIAGHTNGCFSTNPGCPPPANSAAVQTASLFGLSYVNSTFSETTAGGFLALGGNPLPLQLKISTTWAHLTWQVHWPPTMDKISH